MAKAPTITPGVSNVSSEKITVLVAKWHESNVPLSKQQAHKLIHAAYEYAQAQDRDQALPRVGETAKELERIASQADRLLKTLSNKTLSAIPLLDQALNFPPRGPLIETLKRARDAASGIRRKLDVDKGGDPDPHYRKFVKVVQKIYEETTDPDERSPATLRKLIGAVVRRGPGGRFVKSDSATRKVIERL